MKKYLFLFILLPSQLIAQVNLDSLWSVWNDPNQADTNKLKAMADISWDGYLFSQPDSAFFFSQLQYDYAKEKGLKNYMAKASNTQGASFWVKGNYSKAIEYYMRSLKIQEEIGDKNGIAASLGNIGLIYYDQSDYAKAMEFYMRSLKIHEDFGDKRGIALSLNNIGGIYHDQANFAKAIDYYLRSLKIQEELGDKGGIALCLNNIGMIYGEQSEYVKAMDYYQRSLKIREEIGDKYGIAGSLNNIGAIYKAQGKYAKAITYSERSLIIAREIGAFTAIIGATYNLWEANEKLSRYKPALEMYKLYVSTMDSLESEENQKEVIRQEFKYNYEKQAAIDSIKAAEEGKVKDALLQSEHAENMRRKQQSYFLYGGLVLALIFGGFIFNRYKVTNQQKDIISEQKEKVDHAYAELENKNQKILDSIVYAKRIQNAILPPVKVIKEYLHESFIIYQPKDVVAGDFYWLESFAEASDSEGQKVFFAVADCTGHGVPGAMVSVVCNNGLNRSVREHGLTEPGKILDKTREIVVKEFEKSDEGVQDGMDIALCVLEGKTLHYAGAHNPLIILRKDAEECEVIKANKEPIGQFENPQPYTTHQIHLNEGDSIYLFSDGMQDQFGGPKGKKFMISRFKKLLVEVSKNPMDKQKELIFAAFNDWKGNEEQVDDVCLIGVRV